MKKETIIDFELFGFYIKITTNDSLTQDLIHKLYGNIINDTAIISKNELKHKDIIINREKNIFHIIDNIGHYIVEECEIIDYIIDIVNNSFDLFPKSKYVYFHGSAVSNKDNCVLFIAPTMQGKTTLCTQMVMNGYTYLSDDLIIMDQECKIYPFPMPIKMRKNKNIHHVVDFENSFTIVNNVENIVLICKEKAHFKDKYLSKANRIFVLERCKDDEKFVVEKSSPINSLNMFMRNGAYIDSMQNHIFTSKKLSENTDVFKITYNDYHQILNYLDSV